MKIKTVILDLDGTLLNSQHQIPPKSKEAILNVQQAGLEIILASGRGIKNMIDFAKELNVKYIVALNGSIVYLVAEDKVLFEKKLDVKTVKHSYQYAIDNKLDAVFYLKDSAHILEQSPHYYLVNCHFNTLDKYYSDDIVDKVYKVIIISIDDPEKSKLHLQKLNSHLDGHNVQITRSSHRSIEINYKGISKAFGINVLRDYLNVDPETCVAFGDGGNDLEMLKWVKYPFVMGNCVSELKDTGFEIIGDNNSNAITEKLESFISK